MTTTTTTIIAAVDGDDAAVPTLQAAELLGGVYGAEVEAIHVVSPGVPDRPLPPELAGVPVRFIEGDVVDVLADEVARADVVACTIGARASTTASTTGRVALTLVGRVDKPVGLVPPGRDILGGNRLRVLVPLDGTEDAALTVRGVVARVARANVDVIVLHVFDATTVPAFLDRPDYDLPAWSHEFLQRFCDEQGASVIWRTGSAGTGIVDAVSTADIDAVILGWHGVIEPGRAAVVREVLATAGVPVVMVPRSQSERTLAAANGLIGAE